MYQISPHPLLLNVHGDDFDAANRGAFRRGMGGCSSSGVSSTFSSGSSAGASSGAGSGVGSFSGDASGCAVCEVSPCVSVGFSGFAEASPVSTSGRTSGFSGCSVSLACSCDNSASSGVISAVGNAPSVSVSAAKAGARQEKRTAPHSNNASSRFVLICNGFSFHEGGQRSL